MNIGFAGFGKSFLSWNLAAWLDAPILSDAHGPYRSWNHKGRVRVTENPNDVKRDPVVVVDRGDESQWDVLFYALPPDPHMVERTLRDVEQARRNVLFVLNGYPAGAPWVFPPTFRPVSTIPWDPRQASAILLGIPLVHRDPAFGKYFDGMKEALARVAAL